MLFLLLKTDKYQDDQGNSIPELLRQRGVHTIKKPQPEMEKVDALIFGADEDLSSRYLLARASSEGKPVLRIEKKINPTVLREQILNFIAEVEQVQTSEKPSIKFTLRITPSMERYLQWKSEQTGLTKADFLRQTLQHEIIEKDDDYTL